MMVSLFKYNFPVLLYIICFLVGPHSPTNTHQSIFLKKSNFLAFQKQITKKSSNFPFPWTKLKKKFHKMTARRISSQNPVSSLPRLDLHVLPRHLSAASWLWHIWHCPARHNRHGCLGNSCPAHPVSYGRLLCYFGWNLTAPPLRNQHWTAQ